jgi:uncharacterized iron-regulated membrane protein
LELSEAHALGEERTASHHWRAHHAYCCTVRSAYPDWRLDSIYAPGVRGQNYAVLLSRAGKYSYAFASSSNEELLGVQALDQGWLNWVADLHFRLLAGPTGLIVNGVGAACLLLLCLSGTVIWWPGVRTWKKALVVDFRRRWKRVNFDLHSAVGFWTLAIISLWAVSGIYFVWPESFVALVGTISKAANASPPKFHLAGNTDWAAAPVAQLIRKAMEAEPGAKFQGISYRSGDQPLSIMLDRGEDVSQFLHATWVCFTPANGTILRLWRYGDNKNAR